MTDPTFVPFNSTWPPVAPTVTLTVMPSYLYQEYNDDDNLIVFVQTYNQMAQQYVDWFAYVNLPVYAQNPNVNGDLLDWVGAGLYGMPRPLLAGGSRSELGPFNTGMFNELMFNQDIFVGPDDVFVTDDDTYRRILTWHLEKGDGKLFNIRWLKRRIERFLTGADGGLGRSNAGNPSTADMYAPDQTYDVSITFGVANQVDINFIGIRRSITSGAMFNAEAFNDILFDDLGTEATFSEVSPWAPIFKSAVESGALELPFQFNYVVNIIT
jgi:hypothetical protein